MTEGYEIALRRFLQGTLDFDGLEEALTGVARFRYADTNERQIDFTGTALPEVEFSREDVIRVLQRYLRKELRPRELSDWAATVRLMDAYVLTDSDPDPDAVWDALDELTSPDAWELPSVESALTMIGRLQ